ncbi:RidA family protein, partial [Acinetobacter baumannii]
MHKALNPATVRAPFGRYSHGALVAEGQRLILTSGQLAVAPDDAVPESVTEQTELCFANIRAILREGGMDLCDIVRINAFVT